MLTARLQAGSRQHPLARALIEYGKLQRTNHALRWFTDEAFRRRIGRQLNRGESLNALHRYLFFAHHSEIGHRHHDDQTTQAHCHTLVTNASILWTTIYLQHATAAHRDEGRPLDDRTVAHLSPARYEQINHYGTYNFDPQPPRTENPSDTSRRVRRSTTFAFGAMISRPRLGGPKSLRLSETDGRILSRAMCA